MEMNLNYLFNIRCKDVDFNTFEDWCTSIGETPREFIRQIISEAPKGNVQVRIPKERLEKLEKVYKEELQ